jgi:hypothetical protein
MRPKLEAAQSCFPFTGIKLSHQENDWKRRKQVFFEVPWAENFNKKNAHPPLLALSLKFRFFWPVHGKPQEILKLDLFL